MTCWKDSNADGDDPGTNVDIFEAFDWVLSNGCAEAKRGDPQADGFSYANCGGEIQAVYTGGHGWTVLETDAR